MDTANVKANGRLVIPARFRRKLGIKPGTKVCFVERGNEILFQPLTKEYIRGMSGMLKSGTSVTAELLDEQKNDREREESLFRQTRTWPKRQAGSRQQRKCQWRDCFAAASPWEEKSKIYTGDP